MKTVSEKISFGDSLTLKSGQILSGFELMTEPMESSTQKRQMLSWYAMPSLVIIMQLVLMMEK